MAFNQGFSLAPYIVKNMPSLAKSLSGVGAAYANVAGWRKQGLKYDDLLVEEIPTVQKALDRLPENEFYDRVFRIRRAQQADVVHKDLPKDQWIKAEEDDRYLAPHVAKVEAELAERNKWDTMEVKRA
ncbi:14 kDa subunit of cytochrome bd ubiquinol oxidase [Peniophora sp. CONT]|nr:14 kDa subunit of cytochrome bd ubiquinol oxidase [Peniophora sp. CONT]